LIVAVTQRREGFLWRKFYDLAKVDELETTPTALHPKAQRRERSERTLGYAMHDKRPCKGRINRLPAG